MELLRKSLLAAITLFLSACSSPTSSSNERDELSKWMENSGKLKVCATTPIVADVVRRVGGENIELISLMGPEIDPHSYEIVKGDSEKLSRAAIVFANGLSLEHSLSMRRALQAHPHVVYITDTIDPKEIIHVDESPDPHVWMDLSLWSRTSLAVERALIAKDPEHAEVYHERGKRVRAEFKEYDEIIKEVLLLIPEDKRRLVTSHDAFNYFARRYLAEKGKWQDRVKAIQGLAPEEQISSLEIKRVVDYVKEYEIPVIFAEKNLSRDSLIKVVDSCNRSGCHVVLSKDELYGDTLGTHDYLGMIKHNAIVVKTNLTSPELTEEDQGEGER